MNKEEIVEKLNKEGISLEEEIQLRGKLITLIKKEIKDTKNKQLKLSLRLELNKELNLHKELLKKKGIDKNIPIPDRVGLKVKEIADTIELFKEKSDILEKLKMASTGTIVSSLFVGAISVGITLISGAPLTIAALASTVPVMCYTGLTSLLRMPFTETSWNKILKTSNESDEKSKQIITFMNDYVKNNKELLELINKKKEAKSADEKIKINNGMISEYKKLIKNAPIDEIKKMVTFEEINLLTEQKKLYEEIKEEYIKSKRDMSLAEFAQLEKDLLGVNLSLTKENSFYKDIAKETGKDFAISTGTLIVARAIISIAFPQFSINEIANLSIPVIMTLLGSISNAGNIKDKIRLEKEAYDKLKTDIDPEMLKKKIEEMNNTTSISMA